MHKIQRSVLVAYSAAQMFNLVADVQQYPVFMPWCAGAQVLSRDETGMLASIAISFAGIKQHFTTRNTHHFPDQIDLALVEGPFSALEGCWQFQTLTPNACKVLFTITYQFSKPMFEVLVGPVFNRIVAGLIDSFIQRAQVVYG